MNKLIRSWFIHLIVCVAGLTLVGCSPCRVNVHTSTLVDPCRLPCGFSPQEDSFHIISCSQEDPLLDHEMACKIVRYLNRCGYYASICEAGKYQLLFSYQSCCQDRLVNVPCYVSPPLCGWYGTGCGPCGFYEPYYPGTVVFAPQQMTVCASYLQISVLDTTGALVWEGCASVGGCLGSDIRCAMDYLVLGAFSYFGSSSKARRCLQIDPRSPQVQFLRY